MVTACKLLIGVLNLAASFLYFGALFIQWCAFAWEFSGLRAWSGFNGVIAEPLSHLLFEGMALHIPPCHGGVEIRQKETCQSVM